MCRCLQAQCLLPSATRSPNESSANVGSANDRAANVGKTRIAQSEQVMRTAFFRQLNPTEVYCLALVMALSLNACGKQEKPSQEAPGAQSTQKQAPEILLQDWGPRDTKAGEAFNVQPDKLSAIWINVTGVKQHPATKVTWSGIPLENVFVGPKLVTAGVPASLLQKQGQYEIAIEEGDGGRKFVVGTFTINPK
ncbi:MAG: hypothetical protein EB072_00410 [Betaproteobacteria bacterium]|nr:hypothetical protein [Betaproteobacteria bacterium]